MAVTHYPCHTTSPSIVMVVHVPLQAERDQPPASHIKGSTRIDYERCASITSTATEVPVPSGPLDIVESAAK
ncbi:hypothetical protein E4U31_007481 [Claviceps sp. LM219 group G6]|nr:hypothetical protein E4U31_007481 [Claviceps sp. LM219 group G6]